MEVTCPDCKSHFSLSVPKKGVRNCSKCKKNIGRHDKWFFNEEGKIQHRHCEHPEHYTHPTETNHHNNKKY